jgi:hypothetical protein
MNDLHRGINFEDEVCEYLVAHDWLYADGDAARYDRTLALFPVDVLAWVQEAYPKAWEALSKNHGALFPVQRELHRLVLNGLPVATVELKTDFTQSVGTQ